MALCPDKQRYDTEKDAVDVMLKRLATARALRYYKCAECGYWHITKHPLTAVKERYKGITD